MLWNELNELGTLHHTILRKFLTKTNVYLFHSWNLYWWLFLLKGMHQLSENILQAHPNFSRFSKKRFYKVDDTSSYLWLKSINQRHIFYNFYPTWIGGFCSSGCTKLLGIYYRKVKVLSDSVINDFKQLIVLHPIFV